MAFKFLENMLRHIRSRGWTVAVHNDYVLTHVYDDGRPSTVTVMTFWLVTHAETGRFLKGEGGDRHGGARRDPGGDGTVNNIGLKIVAIIAIVSAILSAYAFATILMTS